jgi:GxxExxY protein
MNTDIRDEAVNLITGSIIGAAQTVSNVLGCGFLEKVYENALALELRQRGHKVQQQFPAEVRYRNEIVGLFIGDLLVDDEIIVELKVAARLDRDQRAQCLNYLRATDHRLALLLNFGRPRIEVDRVIWG